jgi:VWFA-related protein
MRPTLERTRDAAQLLLEALRPTDRAMVVSFDRRVRVRAGPTSNRKDLQTALAQVRAAGNTRLYDALALTVLDGFNSMEDRNAIVLFTDGIDTGSQLADAAGALAAIDTSSEETPGPASRALSLQESAAGDAAAAGAVGDGPREFLQRVANDTGGRMYVALGDADMRPVFAQISRQLSHQYLLRYYPTNDKLDGTYREIRVTVDRPGQTLRARQGYRAGALLAGR